MITRVLRLGSCAAVILLVTIPYAFAQATAELNGRVTDESGAVLPGVTVTATQTDTGSTRTVVTDGSGGYVMPNLPTGPYRVEVSLQGFRTYIQTGIVLQVGGTPTINAVLLVGNLEETVSVEAAAPLVDVRSAGIGEVVEQERILELPLQGRQATDLITLAGAAVQTGTASSRGITGGVGISVAGGQSFGVAYLLDGAMHNDPQNNYNLPLPFPDALQEFRVATGGLSADQGMHSGASVNAVTKSGTNRLSGNVFEFLRDKRFNATEVFAAIGPDGRRKDDGLLRNQFGGTLGGSIVQDKLFFFGAYQHTNLRQEPTSNISYVPTAAMMAGDFSTFASPGCNSGRQITLRSGFVNNRVDPALFSPAAVNIAKKLPTTTDPCGEIRYAAPDGYNEGQAVARIDYQRGASHSIFGRYMATQHNRPAALAKTNNLLTLNVVGRDTLAQSLALGDTRVFGSNMVNSIRFAFNRSALDRSNPPFFTPSEVGIDVYSYDPEHRMGTINVTSAFTIAGAGGSATGLFNTNTYQLADDLTLVRGRHQLALGGNVAYWTSSQFSHARSGGSWDFTGQLTGLGLADFMMGRVSSVEHGGPLAVEMEQRYLGLYAQDAWRATDRVTVNAGLRWEPFFGQHLLNEAISTFSLDRFRAGVKTTIYKNAPPGFLYPGDPGFPNGRSGVNRQWWNLSPRVGVAWAITGDGRTALRSSYGIAYDFPNAEYHTHLASAPPFANQSRIEDPPGRFDNPYGHLGGDPHPIVPGPDVEYVLFGLMGSMDPEINSPRVQSWNVTVERQVGADWGVSASYLGSYTDRLWNLVNLNPSVFLGVGPCTLNGVFYATCTSPANVNERRMLFLENPKDGQFIGVLDNVVDVGRQRYRGLKLSVRRRAGTGVSLSGNYTWSNCFGHITSTGFLQPANGYTDPDNPDRDRGNCDGDRRHIANFTLGVQTPQFATPALRAIGSGWRISGILNARSGSWLTVTTGQVPYNGQVSSRARVDQVSDEVYGDKSLGRYLNRAAFAQPAPGTLGNHVLNSIEGPGFWAVDLALSRIVTFAGVHSLEFRAEAFNLFNNFNWGNPTTNLNSGLFGRIQSQAGSPRIMQLGIKYGF